MCGKYNLKISEIWYQHPPEGVAENEEVKILWDLMIQCDREIKARKPDIAVKNRNEKSCAIIDITIPGDTRVTIKEKEKNLEIPGTKKRNQKNVEHYKH